MTNREDTDLMILDEMVGECTIPDRNWDNIIKEYEADQSNKSFPIPGYICSRVVQKLKKGSIPKMIFKEYGINYSSFCEKYKKIKDVLEDLSVKPQITEEEWMMIERIKHNPLFLLGQDIDRAVAYHFNTSLNHLEEVSKQNPQAYREYMRLVHPEEFEEKQQGSNVEVVIKLATGLIESI